MASEQHHGADLPYRAGGLLCVCAHAGVCVHCECGNESVCVQQHVHMWWHACTQVYLCEYACVHV